MRRCARCPVLISRDSYRGLCADCRRNREQERGTREQRGYGREHQRARTQALADIQAGRTLTCWRCGAQLTDPTRMHIGHDDHDRTVTRGPECDQCNLQAAGRASRRG